MKIALTSGAALFLITMLGHGQTAQEWKLDLTRYGFVKDACASYLGRVEFLDDGHLVINAPDAESCDQTNGNKPVDTRITVIDLQGQELAAIHRTDVVELLPGPIGYAIVCTGSRVELLSRNLKIAWSMALPEDGRPGECYFGGGLSPSRTAMTISGPANHQLRLYQEPSDTLIAEITTTKGQSVRAVADDGFLVCSNEKDECDVVGFHGVLRSFPMPQLGGASGYYIVGFLKPDSLLVAGFDGKHLYAETPTGKTVPMGDIAKIKPPFIDSSNTEMSAAEPRRILYHVDGCLLGDFDDCYGVVFRRFAVFDSQTSRMVFRHNYVPGADLKISPNGHVVMEQTGPEVHFFRIP
jgi:hypothetical protein